MFELFDVIVYVEVLRVRIQGAAFERLRLVSPFLLRTATPSPKDLEGKRVLAIDRMGKRIVLGFEGELYAILHLMIAGRLRWQDIPSAPIPGRIGLAAFDFDRGTL